MNETWLRDEVNRFWLEAGGPEPFPRCLEKPVLWALPVAVLKLPRLWVRDVATWLREREVPFAFDYADRPLRGCLVAYRGRGCVLLDGSDPDDERRFSLAHEVGHFIVDYLRPRQLAATRLSPTILDVLDGLRPATTDERVHAVIAGIPIGIHTHLMERSSDGVIGCGRVAVSESSADRLALELLAPIGEVRRRTKSRKYATDRVAVRATVARLLSDFGLPGSVAEHYAVMIVRSWRGEPTVREWLGMA